ncbi:MAG: hypothetical protein HON23_00595 [Rickettsiales bacterium]|nr:hypothetical protein [Rickettsiales bacterium]
MVQYLKNLFLILLLCYSNNIFASGCDGMFYDFCWRNRCDEYISVDLETNSSYPYDSYWNSETKRFECPVNGCKLCGINDTGDAADDCYSPFPVISQITEGRYPLSTKTTFLYSTPGFTKSCGSGNYKSIPLVSGAVNGLGNLIGIEIIPDQDGFNYSTNKSFRFNKSKNPSGYGSQYTFTKAQRVGPGGFYLLQPRIVTKGQGTEVLQFFLSQWGWLLPTFTNLDGTTTTDYFPIAETKFSTEGFSLEWARWRKLMICDDYNDYDKNDKRSDNWFYTNDYNEDDQRFCYIKISTWNKLYAVVQNEYWDCNNLDITSLKKYDKDTPSDSIRRLKGVCKINVDEGNARDILNSGIIIADKSGQYNFSDTMSKFKGGGSSVVTSPIFSVLTSSSSTFLSPKIHLDISGGNPNATNNSSEMEIDLGETSFEYQDGYFKYDLSLQVKNNNIIGSKPLLCLYGCDTDFYGKCSGSGKTLSELVITETDSDLVDYAKSEYLIDECVPHKTIDEVDSVQNYNIAVTGLGVDSSYVDPRMGVTITNSLDSSETVSKTFYLRSYEDNLGNQTVPFSDIPQYTDIDDIPDYQFTYDYPVFDFRNTYYVMIKKPEESIFTYLKNNSLHNIIMPFLLNNLIIYDEDMLVPSSGTGAAILQPCSEFLRSQTGCSFNLADMSTNCGIDTDSDMCHEDEKYRSFICLHNLYNKFYRFNGSPPYYSDSIIDPMYSYNENLITNDYSTYLNSDEYNNLDPQFPSSGNNLCIPNYLYLNTDIGSFNYELNSSGPDGTNINLNMSRSDGTSRTFNELEVPSKDESVIFDYTNFVIDNFTSAEKNAHCEASINSFSYDIRYDYYHKFLFKIFNANGFAYVCYKQYDSPSSSDLAANWEILTAYTNDYYTGNQIYNDFINLNICPTFSGDDVADFLSCPDQLYPHYNPSGEEVWCGCSASTEWATYTADEQSAAWSQLAEDSSVQVKAKCMMDGSWQMTDDNAYCPVYCNSDELSLNSVTIPKTLAVEGEKSAFISASCLGTLAMDNGTISARCSGLDAEEGDWTDISGSGACVANCPTLNGNGFTLPAQLKLSSDKTITVDCKQGYKGTATGTCDYSTNTWTDISHSCSILTCPSGWQRSSSTFTYHVLTRMYVQAGGADCTRNQDLSYNYYQNQSVDVYLPASTIFDSGHGTSCNGSVKIGGASVSSGELGSMMESQTINSKCLLSADANGYITGDSASVYWSIDPSACRTKCKTVDGDKNDVEYINSGATSDVFSNKQSCGGGNHRTRYCRATCLNNGTNGVWTSIEKRSSGCN